MIEVLMAGGIMTVCALGMMLLITNSIATNTRNKFDSTTAMLAQSVIEQVHSTLIGSGTTNLSDCAGNSYTINTAPGGAALTGSNIDFTEASPPAGYSMDFVVKSPCAVTGTEQATYDVRWRVSQIGAPATPTNTYLLTVGAQLKNRGQGNLFFAAPVNLRVMIAN